LPRCLCCICSRLAPKKVPLTSATKTEGLALPSWGHWNGAWLTGIPPSTKTGPFPASILWSQRSQSFRPRRRGCQTEHQEDKFIAQGQEVVINFHHNLLLDIVSSRTVANKLFSSSPVHCLFRPTASCRHHKEHCQSKYYIRHKGYCSRA